MKNAHFMLGFIFWQVTEGCIRCRANATELSSSPDLPASRSPELNNASLSATPPIQVLSGGGALLRHDILGLKL